jgi:uncharacterized membrane protein YbaN (DUF454 family)
MLQIRTDLLLLVPLIPAMAFMLWVLWNFLKEDRRFAPLLARHRQKAAVASPKSSRRSIPSQPAAFHRA